ncbi:uncharacterized protein [Acropora muricata]|uniref:uncharacterized protein isoform X2 n=1 Tax=Acropora muricata TaxID=159855 RepID=UPI0034E4E780
MNLLDKWFVLSLTFHIVFLRHSLGNNNFSSFLDCDFENNTFCEWENDNIGRAAFKWIIWSGRAPSDMTGPQTSDASGNKNGKFAYMEASQRKQGDKVRLLSPKIQGENCLSIMYHMYGGSMGSLIFYLNTSSNETVEWIKSGNHPDQWFEAAVFFNTSVEYQIVLEGVRGSDFASNIAIDNIAVHPGHCQQQVKITMHAFIKGDGMDFKIDRVPAHSSWIRQFSLQAVQTWSSSSDVMYFVYPGDKTQQCSKSVSRQLVLADFNCFPQDFFFASKINQSGYRKVVLVNQGQKLPYGISLEDYPNCCNQTIEDYFFANLSLPKSNYSCPPGWHSLDDSCFQLNTNPLKCWADSQRECHQRGGRLAMFESNLNTQYLTGFLEDYMEYLGSFHTGASSLKTGRFITIEHQQFSRTSPLWGPGEPSGDGFCSVMLLHSRWRLNDESCSNKRGFVCQKKKNTSAVSKCESSWFDVEGLCFRVYAGNTPYHWSEARYFCNRKGGDLAVVDSELKRKTIAYHLNNMRRSYPIDRVYIGLCKVVTWQWLGGSSISSNYWHTGELDDLKVGECALVMRRSYAWKLAKGQCSHHGFLCQTNERTSAVHSVSHSPHSQAVVTGRSTYVTDGNIGSCLRIQGKNGRLPWVTITLNRKSFVYKIWIINRQSCCFAEIPKLHIELRNSGQTGAARCKVYNWKIQLKRLIICEPTIMATSLTIFAKEADTLTLCEVLVTSADDGLVAHGVLQEMWHNIINVWRGVISLQNDGRFPNAPDIVTVHEGFDVYDFDPKVYGQRLTAYLLPPENGKYTFYVACDDACTLWLHMNLNGSQLAGKETEKVFLARTLSYTSHNQWDRFPEQKSKEISLSKCHFYSLEMHMVQHGGSDSASVGIKLPDGTYERPIGKNRLHWVRPGAYKYCYHGFYSPNCSIDLSLEFGKEKVLVHSALPMDCKEYKFKKSFENMLWRKRNYKVYVSYKHVDTEIPLPAISWEVSEIFIPDDGLVAHGVLQEVWHKIRDERRGVISLQNDRRFPNAPDIVTVHEGFDVYNVDANVFGQRLTAYLLPPENGNYTFYVACDDACTLWLHMNQNGSQLVDKETEKVFLARTLSYTSHNQWDRFPEQKSKEISLSKCHFYRLEMHMVQHGGSDSASVGIKLPNGTYERPIGKNRLHWVRPGNSFVDVKILKKVIMEAGRTFIIQGAYKYCYHGFYSPNCSIDLSLKFGKEKVLVHSALPMDCKEYKFNKSFENMLWQKRNYKVFVSYKHVDTEIPLPAISREVSEIFISGQSCVVQDESHFSCPSGECLRADFLCDSIKNCKDGTDEIRCGVSCSKDKFSCADGGCVSWTQTCNGQKNCEDGTDEPSFCRIFPDSTNCSLLNVGCALSVKNHQICAANKVKCDFEVGFCGMNHESKFHHWQIASGFTLTKGTAPPFDHTTFSFTGRYMFIESSVDKINVSAILASGMIHRGEITCIQFWHYMKGQDISSLKIYIRTNESKTLIWQLMGKQGSNWNFGQVRHQDTVSYQVLLEGSIGSGKQGGIAVDDLYFSNEEQCPTIYGNESVPSCFFELNHCDWNQSNGDYWRMSRLKRPVVRYPDGLFRNLGGFIYLQDCSYSVNGYCPATLSSPFISSGARLKCLQFRLFGWFSVLEVSLVSKFKSRERKFFAYRSWRRIHMPINEDFPYQVVFKVPYSNEFFHGSSFVALDDVVFLTDSCVERPQQFDVDPEDCIQVTDCPSSCVCFPVSSKSQDMVVTVEEGKEIIYIPKTFPTNTAIIFFQGNKIWYIEKTSLSGLLKLKYLDLSRNHIFRVDDGAFNNSVALETLKLDVNFLTTLPNSTFGSINNLQTLDCSFNLMKEIPSSALASLFQLTTLSLRSNRISKIEKNAFSYTRNLIYLYLQENEIEELPNEGFNGLSRLKILDISKNRIERLFSNNFAELSSLEILKMQNNSLSLKRVPLNAFDGLRDLKEIYVDEFILCCYAGEAAAGAVKCHSPKDEFSSCFDLMKNRGVQVCVWILGLTALLGNLFAILLRVLVKEDNKVHSFLLTNLALSDLLMGIYLLIIAIKDVQWQGEYFLHDFKWRSGVLCALTGVLSMVSSEVSVLMLTVITTDRLICVVFPFKVRRMNRSVALAVVGGVWVFGAMLSVIPILGLEYFYDKKRSVGFYGKSAVCLPLQLSSERMAGWEYAAGIFIGLNFVSFVYILVAYIVMFMTVKNSSKKVRSTNLKRESQMARRMFFIILTDFLCWMPVILIGLLSLLGKFHDPEKEAYIWIAVFVLPVNSSINPILYTFSTPNVRSKVGQMKNSLFSFIARKLGRSKGGNVSGLRIMSTSSILPEETSNLVGFVVACRENGKENAMRLIKHFSSECKDDWRKESGLVNELGEREHPNILTYCWHCKAQEYHLNFKQTLFPRLAKSAFLLCYEFPESTPLDKYLENKKTVLNLDTILVLAVDLIDAIQCLENRGIVHNNITTSTVLIAKGFRVPPVKAILAGFRSSQFVSRDFPDCKEIGLNKKDILGKNIVQFGCVLSELMTSCNDSRESDELEGIVHLCSEQDADVRPSASQIGDLLRDLWRENDIWDTSV